MEEQQEKSERKKYHLFVDDERVPTDCARYMHNWVGKKNPELYLHTEWVIVRSFDEYVDYITEHGMPAMISFDHDLADSHIKYYQENLEGKPWEEKKLHEYDYDSFKEGTGKKCADWLIDYCLLTNQKLPIYYVHSANPVGRVNITSVLESAKKHLGI